jgi:hypothetical protein
MKYRIMINYGSYEGFKLLEDEFETVDGAVKAAVGLSYGSPFIIVQIIDWEASITQQPKKEE